MSRMHERLEVRDGRIVCCDCGFDLGPSSSNYKLGASVIDRRLDEANPLVGDAAVYTDAEVVFRQFVCPGCGRLLENEIARVNDPPIRDIGIFT